MADRILISRWTKRTVSFYGTEIALELRALSKREAPEFMRHMLELADMSKGADEEDNGAAAVEMMEKWGGEYVAGVFERCVRPAEPFDLDGTEIKDGAGLFAEGSFPFVMAVLLQLQSLAAVSPDQGNASGSRSASVPEAVLPGSSADATEKAATALEDSPAA
jgi:hypothetical protein